MDNKKLLKKQLFDEKYICKHCDYNTSKKSSWKKHIETKKHQRKTKRWITKSCPKVAHYKKVKDLNVFVGEFISIVVERKKDIVNFEKYFYKVERNL